MKYLQKYQMKNLKKNNNFLINYKTKPISLFSFGFICLDNSLNFLSNSGLNISLLNKFFISENNFSLVS